MAILTLADFKAMMGVTTSADDALYNSLLPAAQGAVEAYCDRKFDSENYQEWFTPASRVRLYQYPITAVRGVGTLLDVAVLTYSSGTSYTASCSQTSITITNYEDLSSTEFLWATYADIDALHTAVETALTDVTFAVTAGYEDYSPTRIRPGMGNTIRMAVEYDADLEAQIDPDTSTYMTVDTIPSPSGSFPFLETMWVAYKAGYAYADMPQGLQMALAGIVRELCVVIKLSGAGALKTESITNYDYTLFDNKTINNIIVQSYANALEDFRRKPTYDAE